MSEPMDYASAGVDIDLEGSAVASLIGALSKSVRAPGTPGAPVDLPGGFGGLIEFGENLLALATDGVGSKLQIATMLEQWGGVGIDCMAMNVNDLLCVGAEPIAFVDYVAVPKPDPAIHAALGASLAEACRLARVTLAGGETASLPGIVTELDLSGTALGWLPKGQAITGEHLQDGDVLIGLPASGIHSNGYSLVRKIVQHAGLDYTALAPFEADHPGRKLLRWTEGAPTLGEVVLNPTRIYCDPVVDLLDALARGLVQHRTRPRHLPHHRRRVVQPAPLAPLVGMGHSFTPSRAPRVHMAAGGRRRRNARDVSYVQHGHGHGGGRGRFACGHHPCLASGAHGGRGRRGPRSRPRPPRDSRP
ncbi:MAG: hypothetical protein CM15mP78_02570 [Candidatus Poseidoniales archaeon]|nr:MAG: hypothetical protein CM15mP78_02570 [Candidatus Poseidoniales archaeon]